jgi:hypothetical protein
MLRGARTGATAGAVSGGLALIVLAVGAPSLLDPLLGAVVAILLGAVAVGGVIGAVAGAAFGERGAAAAVGAMIGAALGLLTVRWCVTSASVAVYVAGAILGAVLVAYATAVVRGTRRALVAAAALSVLAVAVVGIARASRTTTPGRLVIVGLDGGSWRVLDPLLAEGTLPATARMIREGTSGVLWSMEPSSSSVLWTTIATGRRPEEHGIHDFYATQNDHLRATRFWEVASARGDRVGIFQWLITWPPDPLPGFVVPGWLARDASTFPDDLGFVKELEVRLQRRERPSVATAAAIVADAMANGVTVRSVGTIAADTVEAARIGDARAWYRAGKYAQLDLHGDVFIERFQRDAPKVSAVVFYGSDALSHAYWKFHEPSAYPDVPADDVRVYGETIREYYRRFDGFLGRLLDTVGPETTVLVISDHGFHAAQDQQLTVHIEPLLDLADARAAFTGHTINRQVYLTHRRAGTPEATADVERVAATLAGVQADGERLLDVSTTPGERVTVELRWDATHVPGDSTVTGGARPLPMSALLARTTWSGSHELEGVILAVGPGIRRGVRTDRASVLDVAPTALAALGYPTAEDMDGRVLSELFETPPQVATIASYDDAMPRRAATARAHVSDDNLSDDSLDARLRALGYVR